MIQLGQKSAFGKWVLIIIQGGETVIVPITKSKWDLLFNLGVSVEG